MKQRFDLIGCEKVSHSGPAGDMGGSRRGVGLEVSRPGQGQMRRVFDLSVRLVSFPQDEETS